MNLIFGEVAFCQLRRAQQSSLRIRGSHVRIMPGAPFRIIELRASNWDALSHFVRLGEVSGCYMFVGVLLLSRIKERVVG